ncbi:MAG: serine--tRNA ligase [Candidatus Babeliales bacterium]
MIDLNILRQDTQKIKELILKKDPDFNVDKLIDLDKQVRNDLIELENLRKKKNDLASQGSKGITEEIRKESIEIGKKIKNLEESSQEIQKEFKKLLLSCPNLLDPSVQPGNKESNKPVRIIGGKPEFTFKPKNHVELNEKVEWFDLQAAANMSGSHFVFYKTMGAKIIYALTQLMLKNNVKYGFNPVIPPYLIKEEGLYNSGNLPKFEGDFYKTQDDLCLIPTAEVSLTNLHANAILSADQLPLKYTAWTSCFRREAGGYGATDRGLIRIHQFEKVENYVFCEPEKSFDELEKMITCSQEILNMLGLHYRVSLLAAQDCSFASAKTFDIEVWLPGQGQFYEVSSCSNCTDFQARRAQIRYKKSIDSKPALVHTLNASSLALPRLMVALMETYQQEDGSIKLPKILQDLIDNLW